MTEKTQCRVHGSSAYVRETPKLCPTTRDWLNQLQTVRMAGRPSIGLQNEEHIYYVAAQKNAHYTKLMDRRVTRICVHNYDKHLEICSGEKKGWNWKKRKSYKWLFL